MLVKDGAASDKDAIGDMDVPAEQRVIRDDHGVSEMNVMCEVRTRHEETIISNDRRASLGCSAMDCAMFAEPIPVADSYLATHLRFKGEILRIAADDCAVTNRVFPAHGDMCANDGVCLDDASLTDFGGAFDDGVGANFRAFTKDCFGVDDRGWMNLHAEAAQNRKRQRAVRLIFSSDLFSSWIPAPVSDQARFAE